MTLEEFTEFMVMKMVKPQLEELKEWEVTHSEEEVETAKQMFKAARESERSQQDAIRNQIRDALNE